MCLTTAAAATTAATPEAAFNEESHTARELE